MNTKMNFQNPIMDYDWMKNAYEYWFDSSQRSVLFMDILRKRGNNYLETIKKGEPPVLVFDYEVILKGSTFDRPVNYDLARIKPRATDIIDPEKRPIVVIDPRAGNGPGIGGSKRDSEIGDALSQGNPVYFILFHPEPVPGQILGDVEKAEIHFIEDVARRHPNSKKPAVIGNCQAGWAVALLGADRPDLTGPLVFNGSPLSYWSGVKGKNPMRYAGGLLGGIWLVSFVSDLGNGIFDGAWLEKNFETLNPGNTLWGKPYDLYSNVDTEEERYLTFEKWWDGYSDMTKDEMHTTVEDLFVGNKLETGHLSLGNENTFNLKNIKKPMILFASKGDNITPPQQALNWILKTYNSVAEIRRMNKVIIYMVHPEAGHLGIFVGSKVAKKEHMEIIKSIDFIESLPPGLHEMVIIDKAKKEGVSDYDVRFIERSFKDIMALNEDKEEMKEENKDFRRVADISEMNDRLYDNLVSPWIKMFSTETSAGIMKQLHPLRVKKYIFSEKMNPFMEIFKTLSPVMKQSRSPVSPDNPFLALEKSFSNSIVAMFDNYQAIRDHIEETTFFSIYESTLMKLLYPETSQKKKSDKEQAKEAMADEVQIQKNKETRRHDMEKGGFEEGVIRIIMALEDADHVIDRDALYQDERLLESSPRFKNLNKKEFIHIAGEQSRILQLDEDMALESLAKLIQFPEDRKAALAVAQTIISSEATLTNDQKVVFGRIKSIMQVKEGMK